MAYQNNLGQTRGLAMYVAVYTRDGKLVCISGDAKQIDVFGTGDFKTELDLPILESDYYANVFLWDSATLTPVTEKFRFN